MYLPGHLAMGYLAAAGTSLAQRRPLDVGGALLPALIGAVTPDFIDKPLDFIGITQSSRTLGHSIFFFLAALALWWWLSNRRWKHRRAMGWWVVGICTHLAIDFVNDAFRGLEERGFFFTAWAGWPITDASQHQILVEIGRHIRIHPLFTSVEIGVYAMTLALAIASRYYGPRPGEVDRIAYFR